MLPSTLDDLRYGPYVRLTSTIFAALGTIVGIVGLVASLVGADVFLRLVPLLDVQGLAAGLLGLVAMPVLFALLGARIGALTYVPFRWLQRILAFVGPGGARIGPRPE
jgi:hypothetical protein